ncbi:MAG: dTDP-4-amino-4,6-dideoxygalactose transaminase [Devosia nanyangense]|uniref:dTDP-4-amino-4,6-dideoxygalactose transaminase n=1 Tax=Devosia nanyangense TaxID=1228055 RepID=A0A933L1L9_9HYPH|nr:dTDP-4-amino-4,6-dideoxygalactose transaminase [Devosia nanyangense]
MDSSAWIPFNRPYMTGKELPYIAQAHAHAALAGDGAYTKLCHHWLEARTGANKALLTHSCTGALEMAALLLEIEPGDEIILPSFTFVSTANAFVLRGGVPVFVDIRPDTLNIDESLIEAAITPKTRAIVPVHYAGVACEMDTVLEIARRHGLMVVEDAAQGVMSTYKGRALGSIGDYGAYSFHETKNLISGEGGALLVNRPDMVEAAEICREKGTDRSRFFRGEIDKYTWQAIGSSFLPGEMVAAFLWAQLEEADALTAQRLAAWRRYRELIEPMEHAGAVRRPIVPPDREHNGHMFYVLLERDVDRQAVLGWMKAEGIGAVFHYVPLHSSSAGMRYGRSHGSCAVTDDLSARIIRLPLWIGISPDQQQRVVDVLARSIAAARAA